MSQFHRVQRYFVKRYPPRSSLLAHFGFRGSDGHTTTFIQGRNLPFRCASLLDYGCGDGLLLASVLRSLPPEERALLTVRIEDIAVHALASASAQLAKLAIPIETAIVSRETSCSTKHGIVLAIGVLDYYSDWMVRAHELSERAIDCFLFTMPRKRRTTHLLRRMWLAAHGIRISRASDRDLQELQERIGGNWLIERDRSTYYCSVDFRAHGATRWR